MDYNNFHAHRYQLNSLCDSQFKLYISNIITDCPINKEYCKEIQWKMLQLDYISGLLFCRRLHTYSILTMAKLFKNDICPILKKPTGPTMAQFCL